MYITPLLGKSEKMLETFEPSAEYKLDRILNILNHLHNTNINFDVPRHDLVEVYKEFERVKNKITNEQTFNTYHTNSDYTRACLIQESIRLFLTEIAPARNRRGKARSK